MLLMEKRTKKEHTVRRKKEKLWRRNFGSAKKKKEDLESVAKKLIDTVDKKAKEAERQKDTTKMKALLMESNASREYSEKLLKRDMPTQERAMQYLQKQLKELD